MFTVPITRRTFLASTAAATLSGQTKKPNIVIITTDQQFAESASYRIGRQFIRTPNMDRIAANGTVFTRAYCGNPLCVPSRTSIFTGRYCAETNVYDNDDRTKIKLDTKKFPIMGTIFKNAGYDTGYFGKWHLPVIEKDLSSHGFDTMDTRMDDPLTAANAAKFVSAKRDKPFLMMTSLLNPHNIAEWSRGQKLPLGDIGNPPPLDQLPPVRPNGRPQQNEPDIVSLMRRSYQAAPMFPVSGFDEEKWREYIWAYYRMIEKVDREIGVVLDAIAKAGLENDTLIVLSADHGDCQGSHGWNQKTILYEEATRIPFVLSQKGVTKPGTSKTLVQTGIDIIPTICAHAGISAPGGLPGTNVLAPASRKFVVVENRMIQGAEIEGKIPTTTGRMVRGERYKYCAYSNGKQRESLVDLDKDPGEMTNLAVDPKFAKVLADNRANLSAWCKSVNDPFPVPAS